MPSAKDTGNGAAVSFGTLTFAQHVKSISAVDTSGTAIDITHLGSTWEEFLPGDLKSISELTVVYYFDKKVASPAINTVDTITCTLAELTSSGNPAALTGTGFITRVRTFPDCQNGQVEMGEFVWKFDGGTNAGTVPTFTAETDA